jgi:hypothetical protein
MGEFVADYCQLEAFATDGDIESFRSQLDRSQDQPSFLAGTSLRTHLALHVLRI